MQRRQSGTTHIFRATSRAANRLAASQRFSRARCKNRNMINGRDPEARRRTRVKPQRSPAVDKRQLRLGLSQRALEAGEDAQLAHLAQPTGASGRAAASAGFTFTTTVRRRASRPSSAVCVLCRALLHLHLGRQFSSVHVLRPLFICNG